MSPSEIAEVLRDYSGFFPGVVISLVAALGMSRRAGRILGVRRPLGFALVMAIGIVLSATVTPSHAALVHGAQGSGTCDLSRVGLAHRSELAWPNEALLNILLFLPLGAAIGLCPRSRARAVVVTLAYALPVAIEAIQLVAIPLGRQCQSADVFDNLTGLTLGLVAATAARWIATARPKAASSDTSG